MAKITDLPFKEEKAPVGQTIWCLFSVDNNYDQPANNLVCWWREKPDINTLSVAMGVRMDTDAHIIAVVRVHQGEKAQVINTEYRLEQVGEGVEP
jgi:hypothetical protein